MLNADAYVSSGTPSANFGTDSLLNVDGANPALVQFDLTKATSQLLSTGGAVPSTNTPFIGRAILTVFVNKAVVSGTLTAAPLLAAWTENAVTFSSLPSR